MIKYALTFFPILFSYSSFWAQDLPDIDVQQYTYTITLTDKSDTIIGVSKVEILFNKTVNRFSLDLINLDQTGKGMRVSSVLDNGKKIPFRHRNNKLTITTDREASEKHTYTIMYSGIPADGLIISKNKYGDRTFFGDNWPNRARNWVPCVDHPSDKALVTFRVTAPSHYQVIANGVLSEETNLSGENTFYEWKTTVAIPTKVMVIGVAKFAVQNLGETKHIPVSSWVYPQNKEMGFYDLALTQNILAYFIETIGPYPYQKLSSVQSKTAYGGMENAGNIFYPENFITGTRSKEDIMAHEVAHQWFGNSATEMDWPHIWLSEGFATYFADLYLEETYGKSFFNDRLKKQRQKVLDFAKGQYTPVVDYETTPYERLINTNSYEKGAWVLHMLRRKVGDALFWKSIQTYYDAYKLNNASTTDLRLVFEKVTDLDLAPFFNQWLHTAGHPELAITISSRDKELILSISQEQKSTFTFPLEIKLIYENGSEEIKTLHISKKDQLFPLTPTSTLKDFVIDPNVNLLFQRVN